MKHKEQIHTLSHFGFQLSMIEIGLGSLLHGLKIPFSGVFLSLNQGYVLCRSVWLTRKKTEMLWLPYGISNIAALTKTLSPAGKKFGPMLSLSMQGLLFNLGTFLFGRNSIGLIVGMIGLSLWSFVQPFLTYYLFFGDKLLNALEYFYQKTLPYHSLSKESLFWAAFILVSFKVIAAFYLAILAIRSKSEDIYSSKFFSKVELLNKKIQTPDKIFQPHQKPKPIWVLAILDLLNPFFMISFLLTTIFLVTTLPEKVQLVWALLRPLAIAYLFFYFSRSPYLEQVLSKLQRGPWRLFAQSSQKTLNKLREKQEVER